MTDAPGGELVAAAEPAAARAPFVAPQLGEVHGHAGHHPARSGPQGGQRGLAAGGACADKLDGERMSSVAPGTPNPVDRRASDLGFGEAFAAAAAVTGVVERDYVIAGHGVRMRFAGPAMLDRLTGSFSHLAVPAVGEPELVINVWDSASTGTPSPGIEGTEVEGDGTGPILYYEEQGVRAITRWNTVSVLDSLANEAWFWAPDPAVMLSWDWASPMRAILHWWLGGMGILQVHGGAVGTDDGGVIIVGRGGSGKSTTSLACLTAGLQYAGDDFVAIETRPEPRVHSLYSSGKLESHQIERFPELVSAVVNPVREEEEKAIIYADRRVPRVTVPAFRCAPSSSRDRRCPRYRRRSHLGDRGARSARPQYDLPAPPASGERIGGDGGARPPRPVLLPRARHGPDPDPRRHRRPAAGAVEVRGPLVSVVIPVYNAEEFVAEALDSVFAQDYEPLEVIAVDDGSSDGSAQIVASYAEVRFFRQENREASAARNVGITAANGEFVAFVDADDVVPPNKLSLQIGYLLEHPDVVCVLGRQHWMTVPDGLANDVVWGDPDGIPIMSMVMHDQRPAGGRRVRRGQGR